jgi:hypothetical protein
MTTTWRGIATAVGRRPWLAVGSALAVLVLQVSLPPVVLSLTRKPWTYAALNPWLKSLPDYLTSSTPLADKLDFLSRVALFWVSADGAYGAPEWGFAVDTMDAARFLATALLFGVYVALAVSARSAAPGMTVGRTGGAVGAAASVLGLSTGPCSVMGCGAPVLPVVGLVFAGLSSGTLALLSMLSRVMGIAVVVLLAAAIGYLGWQLGRTGHRPTARGPVGHSKSLS